MGGGGSVRIILSRLLLRFQMLLDFSSRVAYVYVALLKTGLSFETSVPGIVK